MAIMFGNGTVADYTGASAYIMKTESFVATGATVPTTTDASGWSAKYAAPDGKLYEKKNMKFYDAKGAIPETLVVGQTYFCSFDVLVDGAIIDIGASTFPGTYYAVGDTYARSATTGKDEEFQLIIPKAKVLSENTITMEAEGDPSVDFMYNAEVKAA